MSIWFDCSATMVWNRPPVGIVRVEVEILKIALSNQEYKFYFVQRGQLKEISANTIARHIQSLETISSRKFLDSVRGPSNLRMGFRNRLYSKITTLDPKRRYSLMRLAIPTHQIIEDLADVLRIASTYKERLSPKLENEAAVFMSKKPKEIDKNPTAKALTLENSDHKSCQGKNCQWSIFKSGDILFSANNEGLLKHFSSDMEREKESHRFKVASFCHDTLPVAYPHLTADGVPAEVEAFLGTMLAVSDLIICNSQATLRDLTRFQKEAQIKTESQIFVVHLAESLSEIEPLKPKFVDDKTKYILYVSTIEKRKNHKLVLDVIEMLSKKSEHDPYFIFVGMPGWNVSELFRDIKLNPALRFENGNERVVLAHDVSDPELAWLYRNALFTIFPSLYEGWGLPVTESLAMGTAVVASNRGGLPEASQQLAIHIEPHDTEKWYQTIDSLINDEQKLKRISEKTTLYETRTWKDFTNEVFEKIGYMHHGLQEK